MTSEEYIDAIKMMMENQDRYFNWFLVILSIVLVFVGFVQWRFSSKQIEQLKEQTKKETIQETEKILGVSDLVEFKNEIQENMKFIDSKNSEKMINIEKERDDFEASLLEYEIMKLHNQEYFLGHLVHIMDVFENHLLSHFGNFNYFIVRVESLISIRHHEKRVDINSKTIDRMIEKMTEIESSYNENSEGLKKFKDHISFYRRETK